MHLLASTYSSLSIFPYLGGGRGKYDAHTPPYIFT